MTETLFGDATHDPAPEPAEKLSADRRRTLRQRELIDAGFHPVTHRRHVGTDAPEKCGNCRFRQLFGWHNRTYPKCVRDDGRLTHGAATDVRAWWPACTDHEWGDGVSVDAARSGPTAESGGE